MKNEIPKKSIDRMIEFSAFKDPLFYGSLQPLQENCFKQEGINPFGINAESSGVCFSTSPQEVFERYASPPVDATNMSFENAQEAYKSEWYSKTTAIVAKEEGIPAYQNPSRERIKEIRDNICENASPVIYKCHAIITKPFIVSESIPMSSIIDSDLTERKRDRHFGDSNDSIPVENYQIPLTRTIFEGFLEQRNEEARLQGVPSHKIKGKGMQDATTMSLDILEGFSRSCKNHPEKYSTQGFYKHLSKELNNEGMRGKHGDVFKGVHDSVILENAGSMYANAENDHHHVMVFDVKRIVFEIDHSVNKPPELNISQTQEISL